MKYYTYKFNMLFLNIFSIVLFIIVFGFTSFWAGNVILEAFDYTFLLLIGFWLVFHEVLHGIGFISLGQVPLKNIVFGIELEKGIMYAMCKKEISKLNIIIALLFPLLFIGIVTYILGLIFNNELIILLSVFNIASAAGDIAMTLAIMQMPKDIKYLDLDNTTGFTIISQSDLREKKYWGLELDTMGDYKDLETSKDFQKLRISKISKVILAIYIVLIVLLGIKKFI